MKAKTIGSGIAAVLLFVAATAIALRVNLALGALLLSSGVAAAAATALILRDHAQSLDSVRQEAERAILELRDQERVAQQRCAGIDREIAVLRNEAATERIAHERTTLALHLIRRATPFVGGLADVAVDKTERSSAALMKETFALSGETEALTTTIKDSLSTMFVGDDSLESTMANLRVEVDRLGTVRNAQREIETSLNRSIATISDKISEATRLLGVIEEITEKTNVLAVNAAILAAKAGEFGRGFGVIAEEIHTLSSATNEASKAISENTRSVTAHFSELSRAHESFVTDSGAKLGSTVESIDETIARLGPVIGRVARSVRSAADVSEEASGRLERIIENMQSHDAVAQVVSHMHSILSESLDEAESIIADEGRAVDGYNVDATLIAISGRHMTMKDEFEAVGNDEYDHTEDEQKESPQHLVLEGNVTLF